MEILDGKAVAENIKKDLEKRIIYDSQESKIF